jgi:FkbM family methyltransferase
MSNVSLYPGIEMLHTFSTVEEINKNILSFCSVSKKDIETEGIYVFGVGKLGQRIFDFMSERKITIHAFVDNNKSKQSSVFNGLDVIAANDIPKNSVIYIASATYFNAISNQLKDLGFTQTISHNQASVLFDGDEKFPIEMYQENLVHDLIENKHNYLSVFDLLSDEESKEVFDNLLHYRFTLNHQYINDVHTSLSKEYFDNDVITFTEDETYFDLGGFDGDSAEHFVKHVNHKYNSVHIFEPDEKLIEKAKKRFDINEHIVFNALGIYDKQTTLYFDITGGLDGIISQSGTLKIETTTIDDYKNNKENLIILV